MRMVYSNLCRIVGVLLVLVFISGCASQPPSGSAGAMTAGGFEYDSTDLGTGRAGITNPRNYHQHWTLVTSDGTVYDYSQYYITHSPNEPVKKGQFFPWYHTKRHHGAPRAGATVVEQDFGFYTCITHPPDGLGWVEFGCQTLITHPPDTAATDRSK